MSKSIKENINSKSRKKTLYDDIDYETSREAIQDRNKKKQEKRITNALKSKNINDLINIDEDSEDYWDGGSF